MSKVSRINHIMPRSISGEKGSHIAHLYTLYHNSAESAH